MREQLCLAARNGRSALLRITRLHTDLHHQHDSEAMTESCRKSLKVRICAVRGEALTARIAT